MKTFTFPKTTTEDYPHQEIRKIFLILKYPPKQFPFLSYVNATKNTINQIAHILQKIIAQPRLQILPLTPMLSQSQNKNPLPPKITSTTEPAPRLELFDQPLKVKRLEPASATHPRVQPSTTPSLDSHANPWTKDFLKNKKIPQTLRTK